MSATLSLISTVLSPARKDAARVPLPFAEEKGWELGLCPLPQRLSMSHSFVGLGSASPPFGAHFGIISARTAAVQQKLWDMLSPKGEGQETRATLPVDNHNLLAGQRVTRILKS